MCRNWRNDNHNWKMKHKLVSNTGRRNISCMEIWNSLRVNGEKYIKSIYTNGSGQEDIHGNLFTTPTTFSRRCYWLKHKA